MLIPKIGSKNCCNLGSTFMTNTVATKEGAWCNIGTHNSFDLTTSQGNCCIAGQTFVVDACKVPSPPPPPVHILVPDPILPKPARVYSGEYVCLSDGNLGIQYGHCHTMIDVNGLPLNRDTGGTYQSGGDIGNLIFKISCCPHPIILDATDANRQVCNSTPDCDANMGTLVPEDSFWALQHQLGARGVLGPSWFANILPHVGIGAFKQVPLQPDQSLILTFTFAATPAKK